MEYLMKSVYVDVLESACLGVQKGRMTINIFGSRRCRDPNGEMRVTDSPHATLSRPLSRLTAGRTVSSTKYQLATLGAQQGTVTLVHASPQMLVYEVPDTKP